LTFARILATQLNASFDGSGWACLIAPVNWSASGSTVNVHQKQQHSNNGAVKRFRQISLIANILVVASQERRGMPVPGGHRSAFSALQKKN
jgi:hypothetical protein